MQGRTYTRPMPTDEPRDFDPRQAPPPPPSSSQDPRRPSTSHSDRDPRANTHRKGSAHSGTSTHTGYAADSRSRRSSPEVPRAADEWEADEEASASALSPSLLPSCSLTRSPRPLQCSSCTASRPSPQCAHLSPPRLPLSLAS